MDGAFLNNFVLPLEPGFYSFILSAGVTSPAIAELKHSFWPLGIKPIAASFGIVSYNSFVSRETVFKITYTPSIELKVDDYLELHFETNSELSLVFDEKLGFTDLESGPGRVIDCSEKAGVNLIKATRISCFLFYGDSATKKSARLEIKVE